MQLTLKQAITLHNTHMSLSTTKQQTTIIKVAYNFHFAGTTYTIKQHEISLNMMSAAHYDKTISIFCVSIKPIAKKTLLPSFVTSSITLREISLQKSNKYPDPIFFKNNYPIPILFEKNRKYTVGYPILILSMITSSKQLPQTHFLRIFVHSFKN